MHGQVAFTFHRFVLQALDNKIYEDSVASSIYAFSSCQGLCHSPEEWGTQVYNVFKIYRSKDSSF